MIEDKKDNLFCKRERTERKKELNQSTKYRIKNQYSSSFCSQFSISQKLNNK